MGLALTAYFAIERQAEHITEINLETAYSDTDVAFQDITADCDLLANGGDVAALAAAIAKLSQRDQTILQLYFYEELNLDEIGVVLGVGASRVCQLKKTALERVRAALAHA